jgi:glycosyltransferase involved in cell wall biosynthesis
MMSVHESQTIETGAPPEVKRHVSSRRAFKKILFVTNSNEYGGAEKHLLELIHRFQGSKIQLSILCLEMDLFTERLDPGQNVEVIRCKKIPVYVQDWVQLFQEAQPDIVVFVYGWFWAIPWLAVVGAWRAGIARRFAIQHLLTPRWPLTEEVLTEVNRRNSSRRRLARLLGREPREKPLWMTKLPLCMVASLGTPGELKLAAYLLKKTICVSDALRNRLVEDFGFPRWKTKTIHNGVPVSEFVPSESNGSKVREKLGLGRDEFVLVCTARLSEQKGIDILLQAMARVLARGVPCRCVIVGDGPLREQLLSQAREMGLAGHVFFEGFQEDVRPYLQAGSAFILTSHMEGLPLSILEAMACGLPPIVTDVGGNAEIITHRVHGLIVPRGSVEAIADAISYLVNRPQERAQMAAMARSRVCQAFDIENAMAGIRRVILS